MNQTMKSTPAVLFAALLASASVLGAAEPPNAGVSIWTQNVTGFRKEHGAAGGYTKRWDLSGLPHYVPKQQLTGTLRIWGNNYIKDGKLAEYWQEAFKKFQPGLTIEYHLPTATIAVMAVACGTADLGLCYKARLTDLLVFEQVFTTRPPRSPSSPAPTTSTAGSRPPSSRSTRTIRWKKSA